MIENAIYLYFRVTDIDPEGRPTHGYHVWDLPIKPEGIAELEEIWNR